MILVCMKFIIYFSNYLLLHAKNIPACILCNNIVCMIIFRIVMTWCRDMLGSS